MPGIFPLSSQVLGDIKRLKAKEQNGSLSKDEQIDLHHAETLLARAQVTNLEAKQKALSQLPTPRDLHSTELEALAKAKAMLARPWPGTVPATSTQSSSGSLPPGATSTTHGVTPPTGTATGSHAGTGDTGSPTSTASSGDSNAPGGGTHTTNGVTAPEIDHGNLIPEDTTHREHIDLATKRAENLEKIARKRKLDPHEQRVYDNARRIRDRNAPAQPGSRNSPLPEGTRNTANPDDLAMAGDADALVPVTPDGEDATLDAAADTPPVAAPAQPANAIGTTIQGPGTANPDAPTASAGVATPPPPAGPAGAPQTANTSAPTSVSPPSGSTPPSSVGSGSQPGISNSGSAVKPSPKKAKKKKSNTTRRGVKRNNPKDWKDTMQLWDTVGYEDLLSPANRALIKNNRVPIVDDAWIDHHPEDAGLKGEKISIHHVQGLPLNIPLPYSRHKDGHMPGGFRKNPGNVKKMPGIL